MQKKKKDLENTKKMVVDFEKRINTEVRQQEKLNRIKKKILKEESYQRNIQQRYCMARIMENSKKII